MKKIIKQIRVILLLFVFCSFGNKATGQSLSSDNHPMGYSIRQGSTQSELKVAACTPPDLSSADKTLPRIDAVDVASYEDWMIQEDFNQLKAQGVKTVVVKLTEGTTYINPVALSQIQMARSAGLNIAVYHFARFGSMTTSQAAANAEAIAEANYFAQTAKQYGIPAGAAMILDAELNTDGSTTVPAFSWTLASLAFAKQLKADSYPNAKYYTMPTWAVDYTGQMEPRILGAQNMWVSGYPCDAPTPSTLQSTQFGAWQYSSSMYFTNFSNTTQSVDVSIDYAAMFDVVSDSVLSLLQATTATNIPRIYASELSAVPTDTGYDLSFTLNTDATSVEIIFTPTTSGDLPIGIWAGSLSKGRNTVSISKDQVSEEQYTWAVTASAAPVTGTGKFTDENSNSLLNFYSAHGISIDNSFDSPYFGRIYVTTNSATAASHTGRTTGAGVYILDAAFDDVTGHGNTPYKGNISWNTGYLTSPNRCSVAPDGQLYIADFSYTNSGVFVMDPANPDSTFRQVFPASNRSSVLGICVTGSGDSTRLFTIDRYYTNATLGLTQGYNGLQYNIGTSAGPWTAAPSAVIFNNAKESIQASLGALLYQPGSASIASDSRGGFFISQNRNIGQDNQAVPSLIHVSPNSLGSYSVDFNSGDPAGNGNGVVGGSLQAGLGVSCDGSRLAVNYTDKYKVFNVTYNASGAPSLTKVCDISVPVSVGDAYSMTFDRAGNLYVISTASTLGGYSFPIADNTFTTPAPSSQGLDFTNTGITVPKHSPSIQVYPNPVRDVLHIDYSAGIESVRLIDLTGRTMLNVPVAQKQPSMEINLSEVPAGNYILLVNNEAVKLEKK